MTDGADTSGDVPEPTEIPSVLMLGAGWFPSELGGLERYFRGLLEALPEASGVVIGPGTDAPPRVAVVSEHGAPLTRRVVGATLAAVRRAHHAQVIDVHSTLYGLLPVLMPSLRRKALVVHFHGPWAEESLAGGQSGWRIPAKRWLERVLYRRADLLITLTQAFKDHLVTGFGIEPERVMVVRPTVTSPVFTPGDRTAARLDWGVPKTAFLVCCARRLVARMGIQVLLQAWTESGLAGDASAFLVIAGIGPLQDELEGLVADGSFAGRVRMPGRVSDLELAQLYRAADVNVLPSLLLEGFGLTVIEAAACGTPSIVSDAGGLPEAVAGLADDLVVPAGSVAGLAARLRAARAGEVPSRSATLAWADRQNRPVTAAVHRTLYRQSMVARTVDVRPARPEPFTR